MKKIILILGMSLSFWIFQSCNTTPAPDEHVEKAQDVNENKPNLKVDNDDMEFVTEAAAGGMMEVELGKLATEKGVNQAVKDFGAHMVTDHTKINDELKT